MGRMAIELGFDSQVGQEVFSSPQCPDQFSPPTPGSYSLGTKVSGMKQVGHEAHHSPLSSAKMHGFVVYLIAVSAAQTM
jgi:hypothetical protein